MNLLELVLKQMRQRSLSSWLTMLSVMLGVALATAVVQIRREGEQLFGQSDFGYDLIVGPKGSKLQLVLNTVYGIDVSPGNVSWSEIDKLGKSDAILVRSYVPFMVGDTWKGQRIMAVGARFFPRDGQAELAKKIESLGDSLKSAATVPAGETLEQRRERLARLADTASLALGDLDDLADDAENIDDVSSWLIRDLREPLEQAVGRLYSGSVGEQARGALGVVEAGDRLRQISQQIVPFEYRVGRSLEFASGGPFHPMKFEGVVGAKAAEVINAKLGDEFQLEHGGNAQDVHHETWKVVGILKPTGTAIDAMIYIPLVSGWAVPEHADALEAMSQLQQTGTPLPAAPRPAPAAAADHHDHEHAYKLRGDRIELELARDKWKVSGAFVRTRGGVNNLRLTWNYNNSEGALAVNPAGEMRAFFDRFLGPGTLVLGAIAALVSVVAAVSILVSIYNSIAARRREIAILRALGATRTKVLSVITLEATLLGLVGGVAGVLLGYVIVIVGGSMVDPKYGFDFASMSFGLVEWLYLAGVVVIAALAGLVPALKAYQTSVADNLVAE